MNLKYLVDHVKSDESQYAISGYFEAEDKESSSWLGAVTKLNDEGLPTCNFQRNLNTSIEWESKKGDPNPRGIKTWLLYDGIYRASIVAKKGAERSNFYFAVIEGKREDLNSEQVISILRSQPSGTLPEENLTTPHED